MNALWKNTLETAGAKFDADLVTDFGDAAGERQAALNGPVLAPLSHLGLIAVGGEDAKSFLHNQVTSDVNHLKAEAAQHSAWCTAKGRMLASFLLWKEGDAYQVQLAAELQPAIQKRLQMFVLRAKVQITSRSDEVALIGLAAAAALRPAAGKKLAVAGLAVMLAWPAIGFGVGQAVSAHARDLLVARGENPTRVTAQPDAFAPLWWKIIAEEGNDYVLTGLTLSEPDKLLPERRFERAGRDELERLGKQAPVFSQYVWFTDFPVKSAAATPDGAAITFQDLRFMAINPLVTKVRGTMVPDRKSVV